MYKEVYNVKTNKVLSLTKWWGFFYGVNMHDKRNLCQRCAQNYIDAGYILELVSYEKDDCDFCGYRRGFLFNVSERGNNEELTHSDIVQHTART